MLKPGEAILLDRNCHKSVHYGILISGAEPVYLMPSVNPRYGIFGPVPKARILGTLDRALAAGKKVKAVILTNCTYDGLVYDIADIVREAHRRGVKVIDYPGCAFIDFKEPADSTADAVCSQAHRAMLDAVLAQATRGDVVLLASLRHGVPFREPPGSRGR